MTLYVMAVAIGMGLSLVVELTQAYLPARDSSLTDWLNNSLGTMLGVFIFPALRLCRNRENVISEECLSSVEITEK
jgi:VanZ family protein